MTDDRRFVFFLISCSKTKMKPTFWPEHHLLLSCLMLAFCSHALHPRRLCSSCMTDDDSTLALIPTIYTFQNHRCCHKGRQMAVSWGSKQNSHQEGCWPLSEHGKIHSNLRKKRKKPGLRTHKASHATWKRISLKTQTLVKMTPPVKCFNASAFAVEQVLHHVQIFSSKAVWGY